MSGPSQTALIATTHAQGGQTWQQQLSEAITDPAELSRFLGLAEKTLSDMMAADERWTLRVPVSYAARMQRGNPHDPLLLQVLPQWAELEAAAGYTDEPLEESGFSPVQGVIHKYDGRLLLMLTGACAVHCRYCFRREFDYAEHRLNKTAWQEPLDYIRQRPEVKEVILSGGDPLVLTDSALSWFCQQLGEIAHVRTVRVHTRLPIVLPARITSALVAEFSKYDFKTVFVVHANHANEIDAEVAAALRKCTDAGITLLNQSVLLKHINDSVTALAALSERLFDCGVLPYYLHQLDKVSGAAHFELSDTQATTIHRSLADCLPGYLVPRLVREVPGTQAKQPLIA